MLYETFALERWQSLHETRVGLNLSESGVHPMTPDELMTLAGGRIDLGSVRLGYGHTNGSPELRSLVAAAHPPATESSVLITVGSAEANFVACWKLLEPGGSAAVVVPAYGQLAGLIGSLGGRVLPVPLLESDGWQPDLGALERALADGAGFVAVTNPNNPTGAALTGASMDAIVELAERHGAWILSDEVYRGAEVGDADTPTFLGRYEHVLVTGSLSKAYGLPGLRLGWVVGPDDVVADLWGRTDYTTIGPAVLSDTLARVALDPATRAKIRERTARIVRENLQLVDSWMLDQDGRFTARRPDAGAISFLRYDAAVGSTALAERLRVEKDVLVVPGDHFGVDGYLRIGFGVPAAELSEGLGRIRAAFDELGARR